jgi:anaerobic selenocysteine-containing dehydrogenase
LTGNFGPLGAGICNVAALFPADSSKLEREDLYQGEDNEISVLDIPDLILQKEHSADSPPIKSLFIYNHNPIAVHPEQKKMQDALSCEDVFIVGCDVTLTDSMNYADILLPATSHLEYADIYRAYGHPILQESAPVMEPLANSKPNTDIFRALASRFGFTDPLFSESDQELIDLAINYSHPNMQGRQRSDLSPTKPLDCTKLNNGDLGPSLFRGQRPDTGSGKIELYDEALEQECGMGLPKWTPLEKKHPFILISPSSEKRTNSTFGNVPGHDSDVLLEMHPDDAAELGLANQQAVNVFNEQANITLPLKLTNAIKRGTVYCPKGAWLKSQHNTINALIPGHRSDIAGGACYNDTQVSVAAQ